MILFYCQQLSPWQGSHKIRAVAEWKLNLIPTQKLSNHQKTWFECGVAVLFADIRQFWPWQWWVVDPG